MRKIGILYICTGKYDIFWKDFYLSCEKYLLNEEDESGNKIFEKNYFVWTDAKKIFDEENNINIHRIYQENLGWPGNTLMRFGIFLKKYTELREMDYLFFFNANCLLMNDITAEEFLPFNNKGETLVATLHPGFFNKKRNKFTYEENRESLAYIEETEGQHYFAGGLNGGIAENFIEACQTMHANIEQDLSKDIVARFHDESHWNKYLVNKKGIKMLGPEYLYPEDWNLKLDKPVKIIIRDKEKYFPVFMDRFKGVSFIKKYPLILKIKLSKFLKRKGLLKY